IALEFCGICGGKNDTPSEINADAIEYDMNTGLVAAAGNILIKYGTLRATGLQAVYNVNSKEANLIGNVIVIRDDMRMTCNALKAIGQSYMSADGNVVAVQTVAPDKDYPEGDTRTFTAEHIDYFPDDKKHVLIPKGGVAQSAKEGTFTADQMEGWLDEEHYVGRGNAHIVSTPRKLEAGGDQADYFGKDSGKAVLSGNAWAIQDNNTIRGNRLMVYLADDGKLKATPENPQLPEVGKAFDFDKNPVEKPADAEKSTDEKISSEDKTAAEKSADNENISDNEKSTDDKKSAEGDKHES
ncbi:MAG: hypothetical protein IKN27_06370, partial [Selenomonadaceae bacterium]|nr:hypothetical protein [Selenomonadaceae bacterium]